MESDSGFKSDSPPIKKKDGHFHHCEEKKSLYVTPNKTEVISRI